MGTPDFVISGLVIGTAALSFGVWYFRASRAARHGEESRTSVMSLLLVFVLVALISAPFLPGASARLWLLLGGLVLLTASWYAAPRLAWRHHVASNNRRRRVKASRQEIARVERRRARIVLLVGAVVAGPPALFSLVAGLRVYALQVDHAWRVAPAMGEPDLLFGTIASALLTIIPGSAIALAGVALYAGTLFWLRERQLRRDPPTPYGPKPQDAARGSLPRVLSQYMTKRSRIVRAAAIVCVAALAIDMGVLLPLALSLSDPSQMLSLTAFLLGLLPLLVPATVLTVGLAYSPMLLRREVLPVSAASSQPPAHAFRALEAAAIAMGARQPGLLVVESPGVNAFVDDPAGPAGTHVFVTRGMVEALDERCLVAVFAHLLGKVEQGVARQAAVADSGGVASEPPDLIEVHRAADAQSLVGLKDPEQILDAMRAVRECDNQVKLTEAVSPACFYTWPDRRPPFDLDDRVRALGTIAGMAGRLWWAEDQENRLKAAKRQTEFLGNPQE